MEKWSKRQLERQFRASLFERAIMHPANVAPLARQTHPQALEVFRDTYLLEFLQLSVDNSEADLRLSLVRQLRDFLIELRRDFCFVGSQLPVAEPAPLWMAVRRLARTRRGCNKS